MPELTPRDDIKKKVSEILKRVDHLIRAGELDQAIREIIHAKEVDPRNVYIFAYEERLAYLKQEHEKHVKEEQTRKEAEEAARKRDEEARKKADEELRRVTELRRQEELKRQEDLRRQETKQETKGPQEAIKEETRPVEELERELREAEAELQRREEELRKKTDEKALHADGLVKYRNELMKAWEDGAITPFEETKLKELRTQIGASQEEHARLTQEVKTDSYLKAFRQAWSSGTITPERASELSDLRKRFQISAEESDKIEAEILWEVRSGAQPATLIIIDDDIKFLDVVTETLRDANYNVQSFSTSDDAFKHLKENTPNLIISDINLETSTMGGFSFYEKVRELEHLHNVPFIFLSGLTDEVLVRAGKELGVDDYLTKPFSDETLLATIRGKLKRFRKLSQPAKKK